MRRQTFQESFKFQRNRVSRKTLMARRKSLEMTESLRLEEWYRYGEHTPRNLRECEAEAVALLCCAALGLPGVEFCRGYIQGWWGQGNPIPERSAQKILKVRRWASTRLGNGGRYS